MRRLAILAALAALVMPATATAGSSGKIVLATAGQVVALAADGNRVAIAARGRGTCDRIVVWRPLAGRSSYFGAGTNCPGGETSGGQFLADLALAGQRVAWIEAFQGNLQDLVLRTRVLGQKSKQVAFAENHSGAEGSPEGDYLGNLFGDGSVIAYNSWSVCVAYPAGFEVDPPPRPPCDAIVAPGEDPLETVYEAELLRIGSATPILDGPGSFPMIAADRTRVATSDEEGNVRLFDLGGALLQTIRPPVAGVVGGGGLAGDRLVVLRHTTLEAYDAGSGAILRSVAIPGGGAPVLADVHGSLAVVVSGRRLHLVDVVTGERTAISVPGVGAIDAELEAVGLFYSYSVTGKPMRGRVVFRPAASLGSPAGS